MLATSITVGSVNILLTVAVHRGPGMTWRKIPMFSWFMLFTIIAMLFSFPSLLAALLLLISDRVLGTMFFSASAGGSILWDDLFWFFGHPEVYVVLLPAFGMIAEILPVFSGRPLAEKNIILICTGAIVVPLSYLVWEHHMFITGVTLSEDEAFSVSTLLISLPFDVIMLAFIKTLTKSSIRLTAPMHLLHRLDLLVHHRRDHGGLPLVLRAGRRLQQHLLRRRPLPLRHGRGGDLRPDRRAVLLPPEDDREDVQREDGELALHHLLHRVQHTLLPDVLPLRHAEEDLHLPVAAELEHAQPDLHRRRLHLRGFADSAPCEHHMGLEGREDRASQPVGGDDPRVGAGR